MKKLIPQTPPVTPPGRLIDIGGTCLHLHEMGTHGPAVIFEAGAGGFSPVWSSVQPEVAKFARTYSYDRAGYGWSDPAPSAAPRTAKQAAFELHSLLSSGNVAPPYILVGHSYGGFIVRQFTERFPETVGGLVLVDTDSEAEWTDRFPPEHRKGLELVTRIMGLMYGLSRFGIPMQMARLGLIPKTAIQNLPIQAQQAFIQLGYQRKSLCAGYLEFRSLAESAAQMRGLHPLGDLPLVVVRHGRPGPTAPGVSRQMAAQIEQTLQAVQAEMARLSSRGQVLVAESSGHDIPFDQPERVVEAVRLVVEAARTD